MVPEHFIVPEQVTDLVWEHLKALIQDSNAVQRYKIKVFAYTDQYNCGRGKRQ